MTQIQGLIDGSGGRPNYLYPTACFSGNKENTAGKAGEVRVCIWSPRENPDGWLYFKIHIKSFKSPSNLRFKCHPSRQEFDYSLIADAHMLIHARICIFFFKTVDVRAPVCC